MRLSIFEMEVHPSADIFPMIPKSDLEALAASITENGLIHPLIAHNDVLIDGRNRLAACKIAGVNPSFMDFDLKDIDDDGKTDYHTEDSQIKRFITAVNLDRRDLLKGQKAMAYAMMFPYAINVGRRGNGLAAKPFSNTLLSQARTILAHSFSLARKVINNDDMTIDKAYIIVTQEQKDEAKLSARKVLLEEDHPDLLARTNDGEPFEEVWAVYRVRNEATDAAISGMNASMSSLIYMEMDFSTKVSAVRHANAVIKYAPFFKHEHAEDISSAVKLAKNLAENLTHFVEEYNEKSETNK